MKSNPTLALSLLLIFALIGGYMMWRKKKTGFRYFLFMFGGWFGVMLIYTLALNFSHNRTLAVFAPHLNEYISLAGENADDPHQQMLHAQPASDPYLRGRVVAIQIRTRTLDDFYFWLPDDLRAKNPDEVESAIWLYCSGTTLQIEFAAGAKKETHSYTCDVAVVDLTISAIVATQKFQKTAGGDGYQEALYEEIAKYLAELPGK